MHSNENWVRSMFTNSLCGSGLMVSALVDLYIHIFDVAKISIWSAYFSHLMEIIDWWIPMILLRFKSVHFNPRYIRHLCVNGGRHIWKYDFECICFYQTSCDDAYDIIANISWPWLGTMLFFPSFREFFFLSLSRKL